MLIIVVYGAVKKVEIYDTFIEGIKLSFPMIKTLFPTFLAMILGINLFINSGFLNFLLGLISPLLEIINIPKDILPLALIRPISGSAALAYLTNIFQNFGPDSYLGTLASVMQGSTETTLYVITLYFGTIGVKKIRYSLYAGLLADLFGIIASTVIVNLLFY